MSLPELSQAVEDLKTHSAKLDAARSRRATLREELETLQADEEAAKSAVDSTQKLVIELAGKLAKGK